MSTARQTDRATHGRDHDDGMRRVVQHGRASTTTGIADAAVVKHDQVFFLCQPDGDVPLADSHGLGLYYHDCRYLSGYELRFGRTAADRLASTAAGGSWATFELTNRDLTTSNGQRLDKERIGIKWERTLDAEHLSLQDSIALTNYGIDPVGVPVEIRLRSRFESIFVVRGAEPKARGTLEHPRWHGATLTLAYAGADGVRRVLEAAFDPTPHHTDDTTAWFTIAIQPQHTAAIRVDVRIRETGPEADTAPPRPRPAAAETIRRAVQHDRDRWVAGATRVSSTDLRLESVVDRSLRDLHVLTTSLRGHRYFAAGVPWYVTLFGRDSLIAAIEVLAFVPDRAEDTVRLLASLQGTRDDPWRDEEPGKIMHELRVGEMAHLNEIPQTPYYGSVDATPLFLVLLAQHAAWTGRLDLFTEMQPHVRAALGWIDRSIARGGMGYLTYATQSKSGLANQGWKDSGDSIVNRDGSLAAPPIALVEVQGYVYLAKRSLAELYRRAGDTATADRLAREAAELQQRFERDFWLDDLGTYALALQEDRRPAAVVASNAGQALWSGIASPDRAAAAAERLMRDDMFTGWGIRTLSSGERRYNPIGYHDGTVWPHDNAIIAAGLCRYGSVEAATRVVRGIVDAASHFAHDRLPEVFAGFDRREYSMPVRYPVACHPQAWAAGAVPFMLQSVLGLVPDAFNRRLRISHPALPGAVESLTLDRLRVGDATVHLAFVREGTRTTVRDITVDGTLDVATEV